MAENDKKPRTPPHWTLFIFPTVLAIIGAYFALTRPAATVKPPPNGPHNVTSQPH